MNSDLAQRIKYEEESPRLAMAVLWKAASLMPEGTAAFLDRRGIDIYVVNRRLTDVPNTDLDDSLKEEIGVYIHEGPEGKPVILISALIAQEALEAREPEAPRYVLPHEVLHPVDSFLDGSTGRYSLRPDWQDALDADINAIKQIIPMEEDAPFLRQADLPDEQQAFLRGLVKRIDLASPKEAYPLIGQYLCSDVAPLMFKFFPATVEVLNRSLAENGISPIDPPGRTGAMVIDK